MKNNLIVTGSTGYLGSKLVKNLSDFKIYERKRDGLYIANKKLCDNSHEFKSYIDKTNHIPLFILLLLPLKMRSTKKMKLLNQI